MVWLAAAYFVLVLVLTYPVHRQGGRIDIPVFLQMTKGTARIEHAHSLSPWGWVVLLTKATGITLSLLGKATKALLGGQKNGFTFRQYLAYEGMRDYQSGLDAVGIQNLLPSTSKTCERFAKRHGIKLSKVQLPDETIALRFGPNDASKTIVFFHGGGYMSPVLDQQISLAFGFSECTREDVSVLVLQYALASEKANHYPRQLQQAVYLIEHLLHSENIQPSAITLIGDSAGAHLLLSLLLHLSHPSPLVPSLEIKEKFSGAVLISPWVTMSTTAESMHTNRAKDILSAASLAYWAQNFLGGAALDPWNSPLGAPAEWWSSLRVEDLIIIYGEDELLRDDTSMLCDKLKARHSQTTAVKYPNELHVHMVMNRFLRISPSCKSEELFVKWLNDHLRS